MRKQSPEKSSIRRIRSTIMGIVTFVVVGFFASVQVASAHCDAIDGPVVTDARADLDTGKLDRTLKWIAGDDEAEVKAIFDLAQKVKTQGPDAHHLSERYFFETVVRLHREMEGATYTGLKPPGHGAGPIVKGVDRALATGSSAEIEAMVQRQVREGITKRFADARAKKAHSAHNVAAGRAYVASYVELMHYIKHVHELASTPAGPGKADAHSH
ncbi:MAG: DUF6448 family protein [Bradymonadaceae bacterium]